MKKTKQNAYPSSLSKERAGDLRTGAEILADGLIANGIKRIYGVPGESYLSLLDAIHERRDKLRYITCRHEGAASFMAEAEAKMTRLPGVFAVTRGPGATNASIGLHVAQQDSTPVIALVGQIDSRTRYREAFQELDYHRFYGQVTKWVAEIDDPVRIPELLCQAWNRACNGRPGPVALILPEDKLLLKARVADAPTVRACGAWPHPSRIQALHALLEDSKAPILIVGGSGWSCKGLKQLQHFAENYQIPVASAFRHQDCFDNHHPLYCGDAGTALVPALDRAIRNSDLVIAVGARLGEMTTSGYSLLDIPRPKQKFVHVLAGPEELGRVYSPDIGIISSLDGFAIEAARLRPDAPRPKAQVPERPEPIIMEGLEGVDPTSLFRGLQANLPSSTIVTGGAGNATIWNQKIWQYFPNWGETYWRTQLAPTAGTMGYGLPAAIAAKLVTPDRPVISVLGDGCFQMTAMELATAIQYEAPIIVLVLDNGQYGTIRMHQERHYPGRREGTSLTNPDFVAFAESFGFKGIYLEEDSKIPDTVAQACACTRAGRPVLVHVRLDPRRITPFMRLQEK